MAPGSETGGCLNCYAARDAVRFSGEGMPYHGLARMTPSGPRWTGQVRLLDNHAGDPLTKPIRWRRPRRIFVNSMSDLFHQTLMDDQIDQVVAVMALAPQHQFQVLTKRADRMADYLLRLRQNDPVPGLPGRLVDAAARLMPANDIRRVSWDLPAWPLPNVWWGVSAEDQRTFDSRIRQAMPARRDMAIFWLSAEPLLGPINLAMANPFLAKLGTVAVACAHGFDACPVCDAGLDWVVVGGESGPAARPMDPVWVRAMRDQCIQAQVPFHFKQWGEWLPGEGFWTPDPHQPGVRHHGMAWQGTYAGSSGVDHWWESIHSGPVELGGRWATRCGKKLAGRQLDGRTWDQFPGKAE